MGTQLLCEFIRMMVEATYQARAPKKFNLPEITVDANNTTDAGELAADEWFETFGVRGIDPLSVDLQDISKKKGQPNVAFVGDSYIWIVSDISKDPESGRKIHHHDLSEEDFNELLIYHNVDWIHYVHTTPKGPHPDDGLDFTIWKTVENDLNSS